MECVFCTDPAGAGEVVFECAAGFVILHDDWSVRGHAMIVARRHVENPSQLPEGEWQQFAALWHRTERILLDLTGADRSIAMKLGIQTPHLHVHLYPVPSTATRAEVFDAIDGKVRAGRDEALATALRERLG